MNKSFKRKLSNQLEDWLIEYNCNVPSEIDFIVNLLTDDLLEKFDIKAKPKTKKKPLLTK